MVLAAGPCKGWPRGGQAGASAGRRVATETTSSYGILSPRSWRARPASCRRRACGRAACRGRGASRQRNGPGRDKACLSVIRIRASSRSGVDGIRSCTRLDSLPLPPRSPARSRAGGNPGRPPRRSGRSEEWIPACAGMSGEGGARGSSMLHSSRWHQGRGAWNQAAGTGGTTPQFPGSIRGAALIRLCTHPRPAAWATGQEFEPWPLWWRRSQP